VLQMSRTYLLLFLLLGFTTANGTYGFSGSGGMDGISGAGINAGNSRSREKQTVLTTLNGNSVNIDTQNSTTLRGATVAAVDNQGSDNGNLSLKTDTLEVSSLNNRKDSKSMSMGLNVGLSGDSVSSVGIDFANDRSNSKTKTLGTIGEGSIEVASVDKSNTRMLNRDIKDNEINIYDIQGHQGLKGTVDTRVFTKKGRTQIAEELTKSGMILNTIKLIATDKTVGVQEFFSETDKSNKTYEAVKKKIAEDPSLAAALQNEKLNAKEKEVMLNDITNAVMTKLGYTTHENVIVANANDPRAGHISAESGTTKAYINDANAYVDSTGKLVTVAGHETSHAIDAQSKKNYAEGTREGYATNYGENLANYTDMALNINGYDGMATTNSHTGNRSEYVTNNTAAYNQLDKAKGDDFLPLLIPVVVAVLTTASPANAPGEGDKTLPSTDLSSPGDDIAAELAKRGEALTGIPADTLELMTSLNPKDLAKLGVKNIDDLIKKVEKGDVGFTEADLAKLKNKADWSPEQIAAAERKKANILSGIKNGEVKVKSPHGVTKAERQAITSKYRKDLVKRINSIYANNPTAKQNALRKLRNSDIDHMIDLQLGGKNTVSNLKALDISVNRSYGKQLDNIIKDLRKQ